jgi:hypothetical protein
MMASDSFWAELEAVGKAYAEANHEYFKVRVPWVRVGFRVIGGLLIVASVSAPLLLFFTEPTIRERALAVVTFSVALLAGLNSFLQWQGLWQKYVSMEVLIEHAIAIWKIEMVAARDKDGQTDAVAATQRLVDGIASAMSTETVRFFQRIQLPEAKPSNQPLQPTRPAQPNEQRPPAESGPRG